MLKLYSFKIRKPDHKFPLTARLFLVLLLLLQVQITYAQWSRRKNALIRRAEMMNVLYKDKMYNFGGFGIWPSVEHSTEVYDPARDKWTALAPMPKGKAVTHQGVVLIDDKVWHIGGRLEGNSGPLTNEVWIYDISRNKWSKGPALKHPVTGQPVLWGGGGAVLIGRTIHVVGGFIINTCKNDQDKYHLTLDVDKWLANPKNTTWESKLAPMPIKRNHISTIMFAGKMYVIGGQSGHDCGRDYDLKYVHVYNPLTDKWSRLTDLPTVRSHCEASIFAVDGKIYIAGGDGAPNKITRFNPTANGGRGSWTNLSLNLPHNLISLAAKVVDNKLIVSGGKLYNTNNMRPETYAASFTRNTTYKLGFLEDCFRRTVVSGEKYTVKNLLYTIDGEKRYRLTSNASWLKISKNATGLASPSGTYVEATIQAVGLAAGTYRATVTAEGTGSGKNFSKASFCVELKITKGSSVITITTSGKGSVTKNPNKTIYTNGETVQLTAKAASGYRFTGWSGDADGRVNPLKIKVKNNRRITANFRPVESSIVRINAGGRTQTVNGLTWRGCGSVSNCKDYVKGGYAYTQRPLPRITGAHYRNLNQAIYQTEWTGGSTGQGSVPKGATAFSYRIPVANGKYLVRLYFVELNKNRDDLREFDIKLEGKLIQKNFDIFAAANGKNKAIVREYPVTISDGAVNLAFIRQIQNAKVSAIEVIPFKQATLNKKPVPNAGKSRTVTANANGIARVRLNGTGSYDKDGYLVLYHWLRNNQHLTNGAKPTVNLRIGTHKIKLVIKDNAGAYRTDNITIIVKADASPVKADSAAQIPTIASEKVPVSVPADKVAKTDKTDKINLTPAETRFLLKVFPNPATNSDRTFLEITNGGQQENITVTLFDITGKIIQSATLVTDEGGMARTEWQLTGKLTTGTYLIRAYGKSGSAHIKLLLR